MNGERRKFSRIPLHEMDCEFLIEGMKFTGKVTQTSIEGFAVSALDLIYLQYNQNVTVSYPGNRFDGRCRNILRLADGNIQVGIERCDIQRPVDEDRLLLASFLKCDHYLVSCRPRGKTSDGKFVIRLFNGTEFATGRQNIVALTADERLAQLDNATSEFAAQIYGVAQHEVLDFEFGNSAASA